VSKVDILLLLGYTELDKRKQVNLVNNISQRCSEIVLQAQTLREGEGKGTAALGRRAGCRRGSSPASAQWGSHPPALFLEGSVRALAAATGAAPQKRGGLSSGPLTASLANAKGGGHYFNSPSYFFLVTDVASIQDLYCC